MSEQAGEWVARKDGRVLARAATAREIVRLLGRLGRKAAGAVAKWETPGLYERTDRQP